MGAPDGNGPQILRAHDSTQARPPVSVLHVIEDAGVPDQVFTARTGLGNSDPLIAQFVPDDLFRLTGSLAPDVAGISDFALAVFDPQIDWLGGFSFNNDAVKAGPFQFGTPKATGLRLGKTFGQR